MNTSTENTVHTEGSTPSVATVPASSSLELIRQQMEQHQRELETLAVQAKQAEEETARQAQVQLRAKIDSLPTMFGVDNIEAVIGLIQSTLGLKRHRGRPAGTKSTTVGGQHASRVRLSDEDVIKFKELVSQNKTVEEIAKTLGIGISTVYLKKRKLKGEIPTQGKSRRGRNPLSEHEENRAIKLLKDGKTVSAVSKEINRSIPTIYNLIKRHNLNLPSAAAA